jgi:rhamnosyltransferase
MVIASGALLPSEAIIVLGPFRDDYFIDYIDTEYCLRALTHGYRIVVAGNARLHHRLGQPRAARVGPFVLYPSMHPEQRWYYMARNRIPTLAAYGARVPHWLTFDLVHGAYRVLRMLLTEDARGTKLAAFFGGSWDGFRGRMGPRTR